MDRPAETVQGSQTETVVRPVLKLRADQKAKQEQKSGSTAARHNVKWEQDVVDNEHLDRKKTKICCIYHPQDEDECVGHNHEEHEHEEGSSSSDSSSESDNDEGLNKNQRRQRRIARRKEKLQAADAEPNAYEVQPDYKHIQIQRRL
ncbi:type 1 protein phosphatase-activating protein YPI1 KNAG_0D02490 [Huiozyma naganishii CBS 8797]|uniref:Type 1 phosphatases regulator n=1 Tax=Huiozyma naganishii (strain ATCC MYA-139 / BCRC 22969 / CBS 8797 / KCTC 17520 / NBRC 10181 / NCYC 3082 / Yp74L-3) TaxID=1071383 RepID=J7RKI8_HUIN7|nr:hypothetical protein KNAG_0D02490 [Kazachstania naganishii CBS 8797]CCK69998.1 hypothetical protein KNAG_0D02490 [Kazachstania naganishii CBS 8797]